MGIPSLTTKEAAARLGLSKRQVRHLAALGRIEGAKKLGRDWIFEPGFKVDPGFKVAPRRRAQST